MTREEKLHKFGLLRQFCAVNKITEEELSFLAAEMLFAQKKTRFDIYYEGGLISRSLDIFRIPLAAKFSLWTEKGERQYWLSLRTSYPQIMNEATAKSFLQNLPQISRYPWRMAAIREMFVILDMFAMSEVNLLGLKSFFGLPEFFEVNERSRFGCLGKNENLLCCYPFYPGANEQISSQEEVLWWPVCDAD